MASLSLVEFVQGGLQLIECCGLFLALLGRLLNQRQLFAGSSRPSTLSAFSFFNGKIRVSSSSAEWTRLGHYPLLQARAWF
jgi:hypothetical protein